MTIPIIATRHQFSSSSWLSADPNMVLKFLYLLLQLSIFAPQFTASSISHNYSAPFEEISTTGASTKATHCKTGLKNYAYFVNWYIYCFIGLKNNLNLYRGIYARSFHMQQIPSSSVTHIIYAFFNVSSDGTV